MNTKYINLVLVIGIVLVVAVLGFFGWQAWSDRADAQKQAGMQEPRKKFVPFIVENKGKESEERDAALERDVRTINDAVLAYARDNNGKYPESDFKNPCFGVQYCMKGVNINTKKKIYLTEVPQVEPSKADYHYRAENTKGAFCIKMPGVLETENTSVFQCTEKGCERVLFTESCN
ncbi:hypothetical protein HY839_00080 [Candidatus Azambacteria bacterium]|nr:hypothetical protein [Candidatus Azambacteria bacterium]